MKNGPPIKSGVATALWTESELAVLPEDHRQRLGDIQTREMGMTCACVSNSLFDWLFSGRRRGRARVGDSSQAGTCCICKTELYLYSFCFLLHMNDLLQMEKEIASQRARLAEATAAAAASLPTGDRAARIMAIKQKQIALSNEFRTVNRKLKELEASLAGERNPAMKV